MSYSYSRLTTFKKCPAKYKYSYIDRIPVERVTSEAASRGTDVHNSIEDFIHGKTDQLHPEIHEFYGQYFLGLRSAHKGRLFPEFAWGLTKDWEYCEYDDPNHMLHGYIDLWVDEDQVEIHEYKTGKIYPEHRAQSMLYGIVGLVKGGAETVKVTRVYFDKKDTKVDVYRRSLLDYYKGIFNQRIKEIESEDIFPAMPSYLCNYCPFSKNPCKF